MHPSMAGYAENAAQLVKDYESRPFERIFAPILHLFPAPPVRVIDIGAGSGRHAAALAKKGHTVVAVEPTRELREAGQELHKDAPIIWIDDALPSLPTLETGEFAIPYDLVLMAAVIMHFTGEEREKIMRRVVDLTAPGGRFIASFRHGPIPAGRRMFDIPPEEAKALGRRHGFTLVGEAYGEDTAGREGVHWTTLCFDKC